MGRTYVVAGNGPSVPALERGVVLADDYMIRTNNFFFEPAFYLGKRVDMAFIGGDPRVARFIFETLYQCRHDYDIQSWSSHEERVARAGKRRFASIYQPVQFRDAQIEAQTKALKAKYDRSPTTGVHAVLMAHAMGAEKIILVGFDFYAASQRYNYKLGPNYQSLMGQDMAVRGMDTHLHDQNLDLDVLNALQARGDVRLLCTSQSTTLKNIMDVAPVREGTPVAVQPRLNPPTDWASRSGLYPIQLLKVLRRGSALLRSMRKVR